MGKQKNDYTLMLELVSQLKLQYLLQSSLAYPLELSAMPRPHWTGRAGLA